MKRIKYLSLLIAVLLFVSGCKGEIMQIDASKIDVNTIGVQSDGSVIGAVNETFEKDYYKLDDLKNFINQSVSAYNTSVGEEAVTIGDINQNNGNAYMTLNYKNMEHFATFNSEEDYFMSAKDADAQGLLPDTFVTVKSGENAAKTVFTSDDSYKAVIVNGKYNVVVSQKVVYFYNGVVLNNKTIQAAQADKPTIVIYKD